MFSGTPTPFGYSGLHGHRKAWTGLNSIRSGRRRDVMPRIDRSKPVHEPVTSRSKPDCDRVWIRFPSSMDRLEAGRKSAWSDVSKGTVLFWSRRDRGMDRSGEAPGFALVAR